jgi:hypothetical protein
VDVLLGVLDRFRHSGKRGGAVDQDLDLVAVLDGPARGEPPRAVAIQHLSPAQLPKSSGVVGAQHVLQPVTEPRVEHVE